MHLLSYIIIIIIIIIIYYNSSTDPTSGVSIDYMYAEQGITYSYGTEGRPGVFDFPYPLGFLLPEEYIQPSGEENWAAFNALCNFIYI